LIWLLAFAAAPAAWGDAAPVAAPVAGIVKHLQVPIPGALVFVYGVSDARLNRARTQTDGSFQVEGVPAGVYDVIAYKTGFYPSLIRLWHQGTPTVSTIAIDLVPAKSTSLGKSEVDVWSWRDRLPADVLREITSESAADPYRPVAADRIRLARVVNGDFASSTDVAGASGGFSRTEANLFGSLPGSLQYSFRGSYAALTDDHPVSPLSEGTARDGVLLIAASPETGLALSYAGRNFSSPDAPADLQREAARFEHRTDSAGDLELSVSRRMDDGFDRATSVIPERVPSGVRHDEIRGRWSRETEESRAGVTLQVYRRDVSNDVVGVDPHVGSLLDGSISAAVERSVTGPVSLGARVNARTGSTGSILAPGAIVRLHLGTDASFVVSAARGVSSSAPSVLAAAAPRVVSGEEWQAATSSDVSAAVSVGSATDGHLELRASSSEIAEPLRLYFDGDLLLDVGSIYLFDGNRLEKLSGSASTRVSELFDAALTAEAGRIGGRIAEPSQQAFALTSSDGRYYGGTASVTLRPTRTDVSCAVRRVRQILLGNASRAENDSEMLRISVGQDLTVLGFDPFGSAWRLIVSFESDTTPVVDPTVEETALLRHRVMGGLSISF
jgi:hypothetical protein